jgi:hypothetical protein
LNDAKEKNVTVREISAKAGTEDDAPSATVRYDLGDSLDESVELFGAEVVYRRFVAAATIDIQAMIRRGLLRETGEGDAKKPNPMTADELQEAVSAWKPGQTKPRKSKGEKALDAFNELSDDEKAELLKSLGVAA